MRQDVVIYVRRNRKETPMARSTGAFNNFEHVEAMTAKGGGVKSAPAAATAALKLPSLNFALPDRQSEGREIPRNTQATSVSVALELRTLTR